MNKYICICTYACVHCIYIYTYIHIYIYAHSFSERAVAREVVGVSSVRARHRSLPMLLSARRSRESTDEALVAAATVPDGALN